MAMRFSLKFMFKKKKKKGTIMLKNQKHVKGHPGVYRAVIVSPGHYLQRRYPGHNILCQDPAMPARLCKGAHRIWPSKAMPSAG